MSSRALVKTVPTPRRVVMFTASLAHSRVVAPRPRVHARSRSIASRAASWDTLSGYQKNRMRDAKSDDDWKAIESDVPGARAIFETAAREEAAREAAAKANGGKNARDPMDALCDADPSADECRVFD